MDAQCDHGLLLLHARQRHDLASGFLASGIRQKQLGALHAAGARATANPLAQNADGTPNATYNPNLTDESTIIYVPSPLAGMPGVGFNETIQQDPMRGWMGPLMQCLRDLEAAVTGSSGAILWSQALPIVGPTTQTIGAAAPARIPVAGTGGAFQLNLPASPSDSDFYHIADVVGNVSLTNNVFLSGNGHNIMGNPGVSLVNGGAALWSSSRERKTCGSLNDARVDLASLVRRSAAVVPPHAIGADRDIGRRPSA